MKKIAIGDRRLVITKNLIMMLVMLVVIFVAIFAWYTESYKVTAGTTSISAQGADNVELALPKSVNGQTSFPISNDDWDTTLDFGGSGYLKNLVKDITSGGEQFVVPNFEAASGLMDGRKVIADDVWTEGLSSKEALTNSSTLDDDQYNYISFDFYIRSKQKNINVTSESFLAAGSELGYDGETTSTVKPLKGTNIYRCSSYGAGEGNANAFSSDAIVGAMRVSLVGCLVDGVSTTNGVTTETHYNGGTWDANSDLRFLWLPRPDVYLQTDDDSNNWKLFTGIKPTGNSAQGGLTADQINAFADKTYAHSFYKGNTVTGGVKKGLTPHKYSDSLVKSVSGSDENVPSVFKVSDTKNDTHLGETGHYPTLGQSVKVTGEPTEENLNTSKQIQFTQGTGDKADNETTGYYVYKYTLNIWIEGEDAEARRSMNNGIFSLELDFGT